MNFKLSVFISLLVIGLSSCENDIEVVNSITSATEKKLPLESGKNVEVIYSDSAIVRAKLITPQLDRYMGEKSYMEMPKGMIIIFFDEFKKEQNRLTADYGIGYDNGNGMDKMEAKRHVIVINEKGEKLETEHLTWNAATKKIYTDEFVKITTKDKVLMGEGLTANQDFSAYEIIHPKGEILMDEKEFDSKTNTEKK